RHAAGGAPADDPFCIGLDESAALTVRPSGRDYCAAGDCDTGRHTACRLTGRPACSAPPDRPGRLDQIPGCNSTCTSRDLPARSTDKTTTSPTFLSSSQASSF